MKKLPVFWVLIVLAIASFVQAGCKKAVDYIEHHENTDLKICNIQKIDMYEQESITEAVFAYNQWGDPVSVTRPFIGTGSPKYVFKYDQHRRLTDFIGAYSGDAGAEFWHKYVYDSHNRISIDSLFTLVSTNTTPWNYYFLYVHYLLYDAKERIIKDSSVPIKDYWGGETTVSRYSYDDGGNYTGVYHDNNINIHRTNKIWMFIDRDYSINNTYIHATFNKRKLPVTIQDNGVFLGLYFPGNTRVQYLCDELAPLSYSTAVYLNK